MKTAPQISMDLLETYFKDRRVDYDGKRFELKVSSSGNRFAFFISFKLSEPDEEGSFPQHRLSLERHAPGTGHSGIHLQIEYHKMKNSMGIGKMWIILDVTDETELQETAEGFIYTLREIIRSLGEDFDEVCSSLFQKGFVKELSGKKECFIEKIRSAISNRDVEVRRLDGELIRISPEDIEMLISTRKELVPLFGPIVIKTD